MSSRLGTSMGLEVLLLRLQGTCNEQPLLVASSLVAGLAITWLAWRLVWALLLSPLRKVPGPFLARLTSNRGDINNFSGAVALQAQKDTARYGPVYVFKPNAVCISHPDDVRAVLGSDDFCKAEFFDIFNDGRVQNIVSQRDPALARMRRRQIGPFLNYGYLTRMEPVIQRHGYLAIRSKWDRRIMETKTDKDEPVEVNYRHDTQLATFDIMSALAFGRDPDSISKGSSSISESAAVIMDILDYSLVLGLLSLLPFSLIMRPWKTMYRELAAYSKTSAQMRKEHLANGGEPPADMLQAFIEAEDPDSKIKMTPSEIQAECIMMMLAGSETTSSAIMWTIHLLLLHPDMLKRVTEEIRSAFGPRHLISHKDVLTKLPFFEACVYESLRVSPTTAGLTPRVSHKRGIVLHGGYYIPPGTELYVNLRSVNMDDEFWHEPQRFRPDRFVNCDAAKKNLFTFSYGPRNCIGRNLAWVEMLTITANIFKDYDLALTPDSRVEVPCGLARVTGYLVVTCTGVAALHPTQPELCITTASAIGDLAAGLAAFMLTDLQTDSDMGMSARLRTPITIPLTESCHQDERLHDEELGDLGE
ncbi:Cytochrome P450 CYP5081A [Metarhizium robertsii ARSEF 23]|uniref:Cytochrome P450 CYP5081A n=1 Tax=Metarhizium robertsii (strain ARSEF 23 / ATCC MYA-3075) TaxID=655844 RepID=E9F2T6_METRA|nr:Cytochrome P450 CYP5081A [Metarhizium robertsii ARSEF 23]EFY97802.2 Cytochrome P450 CYP5081A [Metarhizium robertsii ARSEF 23]